MVPSLIVLHYTAMQTTQTACDRLCDPAYEVSAHYLISRTGRVLSLVREEARAWHAGAGCWQGQEDINSRSIGIELTNTGAEPFPEPQMAALEALLDAIMSRWSIPPHAVIGHQDMAPDRKLDPGLRFDWQRLAHGGRSIWPDRHCDPSDRNFGQLAQRFGYPATAPVSSVLAAFRARFRPTARGPLDAVDRAMMSDLADRFGIDRPDIDA